MFPHDVAISTAQGCPKSADAITIACLDQDTCSVSSSNDVANERSSTNRSCFLVGTDVNLVEAGEIDQDAIAAQVELFGRPTIAAILGEESDVVCRTVLDLYGR